MEAATNTTFFHTPDQQVVSLFNILLISFWRTRMVFMMWIYQCSKLSLDCHRNRRNRKYNRGDRMILLCNGSQTINSYTYKMYGTQDTYLRRVILMSCVIDSFYIDNRRPYRRSFIPQRISVIYIPGVSLGIFEFFNMSRKMGKHREAYLI